MLTPGKSGRRRGTLKNLQDNGGFKSELPLEWRENTGKEERMLKLEHGRPHECAGRLEKEIAAYDFLDKLGVSYDRVDHPAAETMEACTLVDDVLGCAMCKNLLLSNRQNTQFYLLMIPGDKKFYTKDLSALLGVSRLSFAAGKYMEEFLNITPGSLSVLGLMNDWERAVRLLIDEELRTAHFIGVHPLINTSSLRISMKDMTEKVIPAMGHVPTYVSLPRYAEEDEI